MDEEERQFWCEAWRFLQRNGDRCERLAELEIERCMKLGDPQGIAHWRRILTAVEQLRD